MQLQQQVQLSVRELQKLVTREELLEKVAYIQAAKALKVKATGQATKKALKPVAESGMEAGKVISDNALVNEKEMPTKPKLMHPKSPSEKRDKATALTPPKLSDKSSISIGPSATNKSYAKKSGSSLTR